MVDGREDSNTQVVMSVSDLHGRTIWTEDGRRLGTIRHANRDGDGRIVSFDVRERWMLGPHHEVPATGMRLDDGDVVVPSAAGEAIDTRRSQRHRRESTEGRSAVARPVPVLLAGREGARTRFGGLDLVGSLFGALVTFGTLLLVGGIVGAIFGSEPANLDTSVSEASGLATEALLIGAVTLFVSCLVGGWCAGRSARFDGMRNGIMAMVLVVAIVAGLGALGAWLGDQYNVLAGVNLPTVSTDDVALWGALGLLATLALMLLGGALGGRVGESWHRRADRSMLDVVSTRGEATAGHERDHGDGATSRVREPRHTDGDTGSL